MVNTVKGINIPSWRTVGSLFNVSAYIPTMTSVMNHTNRFVSRSTFEMGLVFGLFGMSSLYINFLGLSIARAYIVRKYSVRLPKGTIVGRRGGLYTGAKIKN